MKDRDRGFRGIHKLLKAIKRTNIRAGILSDAGSHPESGESIADYAYFNEVGTENIPARPFLSLTMDEQQDAWAGLMKESIDGSLKDNGRGLNRFMSLIGERVVNDIKEKISGNLPPPNAPSTIKRKKSSRTLIDTGALRAAVNCQVTRE